MKYTKEIEELQKMKQHVDCDDEAPEKKSALKALWIKWIKGF